MDSDIKDVRRGSYKLTYNADKMFPKDHYPAKICYDPFYGEMPSRKDRKKAHGRKARHFHKKQCLLSTIG